MSEFDALVEYGEAGSVRDYVERLRARVAALEAETQQLKQAVATILKGFDEAVFVRNVDEDTEPGWAIRLAPYLAALAEAQRLAK